MRRLALVVLVACRTPSSPPREDPAPRALPSASASIAVEAPSPPPPSPPSLPSVATDWCIEGMTALDEATCVVLPALPPDVPRRLLVYLHGITPPAPASPQKDAVQNAVKSSATRAGAAAIVPRGIRGIGPANMKDWWAWPTSPAAHSTHARAIVERWRDAKERLERAAGVTFEKVYVAGASNGAYFLTRLVLSGDLERFGFHADGFGAMSGGARTTIAAREPRPFYVGWGKHDPDTKPNALALAAALDRAGWPVKTAEHDVGHGTKEVYLDEAFAFWAGTWDAAVRP